MNDFDVSVGHDISGPGATDHQSTHVPPRVGFLQVIHDHREHQVDRVVKNAHFVHSWIG